MDALAPLPYEPAPAPRGTGEAVRGPDDQGADAFVDHLSDEAPRDPGLIALAKPVPPQAALAPEAALEIALAPATQPGAAESLPAETVVAEPAASAAAAPEFATGAARPITAPVESASAEAPQASPSPHANERAAVIAAPPKPPADFARPAAAPVAESVAQDAPVAATPPASEKSAVTKADAPVTDKSGAAAAPAPTTQAVAPAAATPATQAAPASDSVESAPASEAAADAPAPRPASPTAPHAPDAAHQPLRAGRDDTAPAPVKTAAKGKSAAETSAASSADTKAAPQAQAAASGARPAAAAPIAPVAGELAAPSGSASPLTGAAAPAHDAGRAADASSAAAPRAGTPGAQIAQQIVRRVNSGATQFEVRLDPPELGRVEVKLEMSRDHRVTATIAAEDAGTLAQLARSARELEQTLESAGLQLSENGLSFDLAQGGRERGGALEPESGARPDAVKRDDTESAAPQRALVLERWRGARVDLVA